MGNQVAVLFARSDSVYKNIAGCDVYDIERDARNYAGSLPVIAHPPCRAWGRLRKFAKPRIDEKELALFAVDQVRKNGGVLEHPAWSSLWPCCNLPAAGEIDEYGGFTFPIMQYWFGHRAMKPTFLYIVGVRKSDLPLIPMVLGEASHVILSCSKTKHAVKRPEVTKPEREHTPIDLALWLVKVAEMAAQNG